MFLWKRCGKLEEAFARLVTAWEEWLRSERRVTEDDAFWKYFLEREGSRGHGCDGDGTEITGGGDYSGWDKMYDQGSI